MKWKQLKSKISRMSKDELNGDVIFNSKEYGLSGEVHNIRKASFDLLWDGEDDPSKLISAAEAKRNGLDPDEIESLTVEIPKGSYYIQI